MTPDILIFAGALLAGLALFSGLKWAAAKFGPIHEGAARAAFAALPDFDADAVLAYLGSAIAFDAERRRIAIWEKSGGARLVDPSGVGAWRSGVLLTQVISRTTATPMIRLFAGAGDARPFFKVGVVNAKDCMAWSKRLSAAFGADKEREADARILGA